jgi:hypothetical protein
MFDLLSRTRDVERNNTRRWLNLAIFSVISLSVLASLFQLSQVWTNVWLLGDFQAFYYAIQDIFNGQTPYQYVGERQPFYYPFWSTYLYLPVSWLPLQTALRSWLVINLVLSIPICWYTIRLYLPRLKIIWFPIVHFMCLALSTTTLLTGYALVLISGLLILMLNLYHKERPFLAGLIGAYALTFKPQVTFLLALSYFFWFFAVETTERRKILRFWLGGCVGGVVLVISGLSVQANWIIKMLEAWRNNSLMGEIGDGYEKVWITSTFPDWFNYLTGISGLPLQICYAIFALLLVGAGVYRLLTNWRNQPAGWLAVVLVINLTVTPYTRPYDYAMLIIPLVFVLAAIYFLVEQKRYWYTAYYGFGVGLIFALPIFSVDYRWFYWQALILSVLVLSVNVGFFPSTTKTKSY